MHIPVVREMNQVYILSWLHDSVSIISERHHLNMYAKQFDSAMI